MKLNADKPHLWKADVERSIDSYNDWFLRFAPTTYRAQRKIRTKEVREAFELASGSLLALKSEILSSASRTWRPNQVRSDSL
jgi:hypothetical protein